MPQTLDRHAKDTLTAVELNHGDTLQFRLRNGQVRTLEVEDSAAQLLERVKPGGVVYQFTCRVRIDGCPMTLQRYVCTQESFYEPYVINGMRIWLDAVSAIFRLLPMRKMEKEREPHADVRLAVQDATLGICPQPMGPWYRNEASFIDIGDCYNGDDCWLGAYLGKACHGGLDINHRKGDPLWAPIDFDDQWLFNSLKAGHNNNRWRGVRKWSNGDVWSLQTHHLIKLLVEEHQPIRAGTQYATAAGVWVGSHNHTHFVFKVAPAEGGPEIHLDPWIVFWQIFETAKAAGKAIRAAMEPLGPVHTGQRVSFSGKASRKGGGAGKLEYYWTFGDGGGSNEPEPGHVYMHPGIFPVRLVVDDGAARAACTQHLTVKGSPIKRPALALMAPDKVAFYPRPISAMDVYGRPPKLIPHALQFVARGRRRVLAAKPVVLSNTGGGTLPPAGKPAVKYLDGKGWLELETKGESNWQHLNVSVNATGLKHGTYRAVVTVDCAEAINSPQSLHVILTVPKGSPDDEVVVDDRDEGFYCTPYFWVGHRFCQAAKKGHGGLYLTNGGRSVAGEFARFCPDLKAGRYKVSLSAKTPFSARTQFNVRVRHAHGDETLRVAPSKSRVIGTFEFDDGADGFVDILAGEASGVVPADAIIFKKL